jgi:potassium efflux system protein
MRRCRWVLGLGLGIAVLGGVIRAEEGDPAPAEEGTAAPGKPAAPEKPAPPEGIPVSQIAVEAEDTGAGLRAVEATAKPLPSVTLIENRLPLTEERVAEGTGTTVRLLAGAPMPDVLEELQVSWVAGEERAQGWMDTLTKRAEQLEHLLVDLDKNRARWTATRQAAREAGAPAATLDRIESTLVLLDGARDAVMSRRAQVLVLQDRVARVLARSGEMDQLVQDARRAQLGQLFVQDGEPIWRLGAEDVWRKSGRQAEDLLRVEGPALRAFAQEHGETILGGSAFLLALGLAFTWMRRRVGRWTAIDDTLDWRFRPLAYPWGSAALLTLVLVAALPPPEPRIVMGTATLLGLIPILRLVGALVPAWLVPAVWVIGGVQLLDRLRLLLASAPLLEHVMFLLELIALVAALAWFRRHVVAKVENPASRQRWSWAAAMAQALAAAALGASALGYLHLGRAIEFVMLTLTTYGLVLLALVRLSDALLGFALRARPLRLLRTVQYDRKHLELWLGRVARLAAAALWAMAVANRLAVAGPIRNGLATLFGTRVGWGTVSISLGDLAAFALVVWLTFRLSAALRSFLEHDLFSRVELQRGVSAALLSLAHYTVLLVGFLLALGALGLDFTRITILAGAIGVGVGFGLQNVVNNFVSGLILLFERPIQVGDSVQMGQLLGEVRRIGIRSSTVRTFDGAEVIVPNASLVSDQVTNWTLSDRMRRIDLAVGVAYGSDPQEVVARLREAARASAGVLSEPAPQVLFVGFGDSSLDFQVRVWTARYEEWLQTRSELGIAILTALHDAGITIPFPQRDLHLVQDASPAPAASGS